MTLAGTGRRWALVGLLLGGAGVAAAFKVKGESAPRKPDTSASPSPVDEPVRDDEHARVEALTRRIAVLEARLTARDATNGRAAATERPPRSPPEPERRSPAEIQAEQHQAAERRRTELDEVLAAEPIDRAWAPAFEATIRGVLTGEAFAGSSPTAITCRATVCRLELDHRDQDAQDRFGEALAMNKPAVSELWGTRVEDGSGGFHSVVYLVKKGSPTLHSLASP